MFTEVSGSAGMRLVVSRKTYELVTADISGLPVPRRTLFGRYDYGELNDATVDVLLDRLEDAAHTSRAGRNDWTILHMIASRGRQERVVVVTNRAALGTTMPVI